MIVSILGCGWLGNALAVVLNAKGFEVKASRSSKESWNEKDFPFLKKYVLKAYEDKIEIDDSDFFDSDYIVIAIPPNRRSNEADQYPLKIKQICSRVKTHTHVIFISSTSVYQTCNDLVTETGVINNDHYVFKAEQQVKSIASNYTLLRFSGLIGYNRGKLQADKVKRRRSLDTPMNLVHLDDCVMAILEVVENEPTNDVYNVCADEHPTRLTYYSQFYKPAILEEMFDHQKEPYKLVGNEKFKTQFNFKYQYPSPSNIFTNV